MSRKPDIRQLDWLSRRAGVDRSELRDRIHEIKAAYGLSPADTLRIKQNGIYVGTEYVCSLSDWN